MKSQFDKKTFRAVFGAVLFATASCVATFAQAETSMERVERTKVLRVGVVNGATPYYHKSLTTNEWSGFGPDFAKNLAGNLQVDVKYVETTWGNAVLDLQANKIDVMFGMAPTPARQEMVNFSKPIFQNTYTMVCKNGYPEKTWDQFNSPDSKISVDVGSSMDNFATMMLPNAAISRLESTSAATMALQSGRVDCQILVILLAQPLLKKLPTIGAIQVPTPVLSAPVTIGMQKETDPAFKEAVDRWVDKEQKSGEIRKVILMNMQKLAGVDPASFPTSVKFE
ncbi:MULTISPECIES: transporter substrate-binding domain-containing protein [Pseudomonas]|uniref:Transporter substrate-binding domain-containing protein n=1 Tax=Pseudomonas taiwanensis TaxID=470150 RepID=A0A7L9GB03_9PSED|nr:MULTISPECIES: transporter substrate-binding domain-containing protein [Pseudomonas]MDD2146704.1 transporter substrate-binding domain-containing protein [Pseudomonas putida]QOJ89503.1 transporter substrate-binding domain-containing protein [Pseudomonas taiwanensis]WQQ35136.1 transporter substrate-binding domain-containing protein [Pseudomonas putida]HDS1705648.1 transporter substrate-binding domain-containing protein [Pseudomonas putida]